MSENINDIHRNIANAYMEEYRHLGPLQDAPASYDYKKYMTTSLIARGFLTENSKNISELYRASINELFSQQFKNLILYDPKRLINGIYSGIANVKNMGPIGVHDFLSSIFGLIPAKYLPIFEPFYYELKKDNTIKLDYTEDEKKNIVINRGSRDGVTYSYTKLTSFDRLTGPELGKDYFVNPKLPDTMEYSDVDTINTNYDPDTTYYVKKNDEFVEAKDIDFDKVDLYTKIEGDELTKGTEDGREYYKKVKLPNTIVYVSVKGSEPDVSTQYYIKDPTNEENYIIAEKFVDRKELVKVEQTDVVKPIPGMDYYYLENGEYEKCDPNVNLGKEYVYEETTDIAIVPTKRYFVKELDGNYRPVDTTDYKQEEITKVNNVEVYVKVSDKALGPQPDTEYYVKKPDVEEFLPITLDNLPEANVYGETSDPAYDESKTYYVEDGDSYREAIETDFNKVENTSPKIVDIYEKTTDPTYVDSKTYYISIDGNDYREAEESDFDIQNTQATNYEKTVDLAYDESKTYYVEDADSYREAIDSDFTMGGDDGNTREFNPDVNYYEASKVSNTTKSFKTDVEYFEKRTEEIQETNGTFTISFKDDVTYYEVTSKVRTFDMGTDYYTKIIENRPEVIEKVLSFDPDMTYYERRETGLNVFLPNITYYEVKVVGKSFIPGVDYFVKQIIENGYKYEITNDFDIITNYSLLDKASVEPDPNETYYIQTGIDQYDDRTNVLTWDENTEYYTRHEHRAFKQDIDYYRHDVETRFKVATLTNPGYKYYTGTTVDNGYDVTRYEIAVVTDSFEDRDYYTADIDFENTVLTDKELGDLRKEKVISKLNEMYNYYIKDVLTTARELFTKHDLLSIVKSVHIEASEYELQAIRILYKKILQVLYVLVYTINVSEDIDNTCVPYKLITESVDKLLSKIGVVSEMIPTKQYYSNKVLSNYISEEKKHDVFNRYSIVSPFVDLVTMEDQTVTIDEMTTKLTENIITYRSLLERTDIIAETDNNHLLALFTMTYNIFVQLFFNSAYISKNKAPIVMSVTELFKRFTPNFDNIISGESIKNFVNLTE